MRKISIALAFATFMLALSPSQANLITNQVTVAATATLIAASRPGRRQVVIVQLGATDVYLGGSAVSTTTGLLLTGTKGTTITIETTGAIYGIVAAATQAVSVAETF